MGELLRRRALMLPGSGELPDWDYEWDTTPKLSEDGWTKTVSSTGSPTEGYSSGGYYYLRTNGASSAYICLTRPGVYSKSTIYVNYRIGSSAMYFDVCLSDGTTGIDIRSAYMSSAASNTGIFLSDADHTVNTTGMQKLRSFTRDKTFKLIIELDNGYADVYSRNSTDGEDWQQLLTHYDCSAFTGIHTQTLLCATSRYTSTQTTYVYNVNMRLGRSGNPLI